jgi:carbonic anhydrase
MNRKRTSIALCFAVIAGSSFAKDSVNWGYDGKTGPEFWGDLSPDFLMCKTGKSQAPIDIPVKLVQKSDATMQTAYRPSRAMIINNGHTIQINLPNAGYAEFNGEDYTLLQIHFHTPSEEKVDGKSYPLNAHLVHINPGDSEYDSEAGKLAVIGVFFKEGKENAALKNIFAEVPSQKSKERYKIQFDTRALLPQNKAFYSYEGSLTTPGCAEGVQFYILKTPVEVSKKQLEQFKKLYPLNARPTMPLNGRKITEGN